jgi:hypothetical protein
MGDGMTICPACKARRLPVIPPDSVATASACQDCGHVVERERAIDLKRPGKEIKS